MAERTLLLSSREPQQVMAAMEQRIGRQSGILIVPITSVSAWRIHELAKRQEWDRFNSRSGIKIDGINPELHDLVMPPLGEGGYRVAGTPHGSLIRRPPTVGW